MQGECGTPNAKEEDHYQLPTDETGETPGVLLEELPPSAAYSPERLR